MSTENIQILGTAVATVVAAFLAYILYTSSGSGKPVLSKEKFQKFPLVQKTVLSHNSAVYRFGLPNPNDILGLPIGQHISIQATIDGQNILRSYTPITLDDQKGHFDLLIKSYANGNISKFVADLNIGDSINVKGPKGFYKYEPNTSNCLGMVAGGTGIAPMYQLIQAIAKNPSDKTKIVLLYGNVTEEDILLKKELDEITAHHENIKVHYVLDKPPKDWTGGSGYITSELLSQFLPGPAAENKLLVCGPPLMVSSIKKAAVGLGYQKAKPISKADDQVFVF